MGERAQERKGEEAMIQMTPLMKDLLEKVLADGTPCLVGTAS